MLRGDHAFSAVAGLFLGVLLGQAGFGGPFELVLVYCFVLLEVFGVVRRAATGHDDLAGLIGLLISDFAVAVESRVFIDHV